MKRLIAQIHKQLAERSRRRRAGTRDESAPLDYFASRLGANMIEEHSSVVLTETLPAAGLEAGDVGVVVHVHRNGEAFEAQAAIRRRRLTPRSRCPAGQ